MLFNNPYVQKAIKDMDSKQREHYRKIGEALYGNVNFEDCKNINNLPPPTRETVDYLKTTLRSGFHPRYLNQTEIEVLFGHCGDKWWEEFGYKFEDIPQLKGTSMDPEMSKKDAVTNYMDEKLKKKLDGMPKELQDKLMKEFIKQFKK